MVVVLDLVQALGCLVQAQVLMQAQVMVLVAPVQASMLVQALAVLELVSARVRPRRLLRPRLPLNQRLKLTTSRPPIAVYCMQSLGLLSSCQQSDLLFRMRRGVGRSVLARPALRLRQNVLHHMTVHIGQTIVTPLELIGQAFVIDPELVEQRRL